MNLGQYADILRSIQHKPYEDGLYTNKKGNPGYRAVFNVGKNWYWYSVPGTTETVDPAEVAEAISKGVVTHTGQFKLNGFERTISFAGRSYIVNAGSHRP